MAPCTNLQEWLHYSAGSFRCKEVGCPPYLRDPWLHLFCSEPFVAETYTIRPPSMIGNHPWPSLLLRSVASGVRGPEYNFTSPTQETHVTFRHWYPKWQLILWPSVGGIRVCRTADTLAREPCEKSASKRCKAVENFTLFQAPPLKVWSWRMQHVLN